MPGNSIRPRTAAVRWNVTQGHAEGKTSTGVFGSGRSCGLTRLYASPDAREKPPDANNWTQVRDDL